MNRRASQEALETLEAHERRIQWQAQIKARAAADRVRNAPCVSTDQFRMPADEIAQIKRDVAAGLLPF